METVSLRKIYNQFRKCPDYETLSYSYFKYALMKRLEKALVPGKSMNFVFDSGQYPRYLQLSIDILDILKAVKISKKEFLKIYEERKKDYPGTLYE